MNNACIIGYGMVGKALADVFGIKKIYTRNPKDTTITLKEASNCKLVFICLPTPVNENGEYFVQDIVNTIKEIESFGNIPIYVIRSTVFPGFAKNLQILFSTSRFVSNPEFLSEATAVEDTKHPPFILIGGIGYPVSEVKAFYEAVVKSAPVITTDNTTAEMAKLTMNAFFATKVIFANQAYDACQQNGANYQTVKKVLEAHPYGPNNHFEIFFRGKRGVRGACLPKDSKAFAYYTRSTLVSIVEQLNEGLVNEI